jgi:hypothetical protein
MAYKHGKSQKCHKLATWPVSISTTTPMLPQASLLVTSMSNSVDEFEDSLFVIIGQAAGRRAFVHHSKKINKIFLR